MKTMFKDFLNRFDVWALRRSWSSWMPFFLVMTFLFYQMFSGEGHSGLFSGINLGVHEMGHLFVCFQDGTLCSAGGTLLQIAAPIISVFILIRGGEFFGVPFCGLWLASNLFEISTYMADATKMELPLVTVGGGEGGHDWNTIFSNLGLLPYDQMIAQFTATLAFSLAVASLVLCGYLLYRMKKVSS